MRTDHGINTSFLRAFLLVISLFVPESLGTSLPRWYFPLALPMIVIFKLMTSLVTSVPACQFFVSNMFCSHLIFFIRYLYIVFILFNYNRATIFATSRGAPPPFTEFSFCLLLPHSHCRQQYPIWTMEMTMIMYFPVTLLSRNYEMFEKEVLQYLVLAEIADCKLQKLQLKKISVSQRN